MQHEYSYSETTLHEHSYTETTMQYERSYTESTITVDYPSSPVTLPVPLREVTAVPPVIPPNRPGRTLVLCFDGTGDQFDSDNSNIVEFFTMLKKDDTAKQMVYYQAGIGTYTTPQIATPIRAKLSKSLDEAVAWNLHAHVMDGYEYLMQNYTAGDKICIFGFSRGAYTARSLAGMIHKVGILPACNHQQVPFAYKMFTKADNLGWKQSNAFKKAFSIDADIEFIGVWDTVNSVGLIPHTLPFATSNTIVHTFRHAIALDERRAKFKANLWNEPTADEQMLSITDQAIHEEEEAKKAAREEEAAKKRKEAANARHNHPYRTDSTSAKSQKMHEKEHSRNRATPTDIEEVWFAGCHCDIGGGSVANDTPNNLARIPLRWMVRQCFKTNTGIMFDSQLIRDIGIDPASLWPEVCPRPPALTPTADMRIKAIPEPPPKKDSDCAHDAHASPSKTVKPQITEEQEDLNDALEPIYDQLALKKFWWLLEFWPFTVRYQIDNILREECDLGWRKYIPQPDSRFSWLLKLWPFGVRYQMDDGMWEQGSNFGRGRFIPQQKDQKIKVHRSVKTRMDVRDSNGERMYVPAAVFDLAHTTWVE